MDISRKDNFIDSYNYEFNNGDNRLLISFERNMDLYFQLFLKKRIEFGKSAQINFDITKEDYDLFLLFDELYNDVISYKIDEYNNRLNNKFYLQDRYEILVDNNKNITWVSDEGQFDYEDAFKISKINCDIYRMTFIRNPIMGEFFLKNAHVISVRISNSGSRYDPFNIIFMRFFNNLQKIDPNNRQINNKENLSLKKIKNN